MPKVSKSYSAYNNFANNTRRGMDLVSGTLGRVIPGGGFLTDRSTITKANRSSRTGGVMGKFLTGAFGGGRTGRLASSAVRFGGVLGGGAVMYNAAGQWSRGEVGLQGTIASGYMGYRLGAAGSRIGGGFALGRHAAKLGKVPSATKGAAFLGARRGKYAAVGAMIGGLAGIMM